MMPWCSSPRLLELTEGGETMPVQKDSLTEEEKAFLRNVGYRVKYFRMKSGLSQMEVAELSGLSDSTLSHLESTNVYAVSCVALHRIAKALDVKPEALFRFD